MKWLAGLFSALVLLAGIAAITFVIWTRPAPTPLGALIGPVDRIVIDKTARRMTVYREGAALRDYRIALGFTPAGHKTRQGDGRTPEGVFHIDRRNEHSAYHLSLGLDYPRAEDRVNATTRGVDPGGDIFIHGQPNALPVDRLLRGDWTAGCIALGNAEMRDLWDVVAIGTEVEIRP